MSDKNSVNEKAVQADAAEYESHLFESMKKIVTHLESAINLQENARYIDVWKKLHAVRDSMYHNMNIINQRIERMNHENNSE